MNAPATSAADNHYHGLNFTVHEYHNSTSSDRTSQNTILNDAYLFLRTVIHGYRKNIPGAANIPVSRSNTSHYFTLVEKAPVIETSPKGQRMLKEWGEAVTPEEIFELHELEDFNGTDLTHLLKDGKEGESPKPDMLIRTKDKVAEHPERESKKRKLNLAPIYHLIPQPHIYPSTFLSSEPPFKDLTFSSAEPCFVSPYSSLSVSDDTRVAWLIPIRGVLPWKDCSSGTLLEDESDYGFPPAAGANAQISWTPASLLKFWDFLVDLRASSTVGALGLSFHSAQNIKRARPKSVNPKKPPFSTSVPTSNSIPGSAGPRPTLVTLDYIKVYHDLRRRLHLRHLLDEWSYSLPLENEHSQYVKVLKHARLVLLDDVSQAILIL